MGYRIYVSQHCQPCEEVKKALENSVPIPDLKVIDIDTDEGFAEFAREILQKGDGAVPSAFHNGKECKIGFDQDGGLMLDCPDPDLQSESSPPVATA